MKLKKILHAIVYVILIGALCFELLFSIQFFAKNAEYPDRKLWIYDNAAVFSDDELKELEKLKSIYESYEYNLIVLTISEDASASADCAELFYDNHDFKGSGVMLLLNVQTNELTLFPFGQANDMFTTEKIDEVGQRIEYDLIRKNYYEVIKNAKYKTQSIIYEYRVNYLNADSKRVYDESSFLDASSYELLNYTYYSSAFSESFSYALITTFEPEERFETFGKEFYYSHPFKEDGFLLIFNPEIKAYKILEFGKAKDLFSKTEKASILYNIDKNFQEENYLQAFLDFPTKLHENVKLRMKYPYMNILKNTRRRVFIDYEKMKFWDNVLLSIILAAIFSVLITMFIISKLRKFQKMEKKVIRNPITDDFVEEVIFSVNEDKLVDVTSQKIV